MRPLINTSLSDNHKRESSIIYICLELPQTSTMSFHWTQTKAILDGFFKLLACEKCKKTPEKPLKFITCGHMFCDTCCTKKVSACMKCNMQVRPNEIQPYHLVAQLISYCENIKEAIRDMHLENEQKNTARETVSVDENVARCIASMIYRAKDKDSESETPGYRNPTQNSSYPEVTDVDWDTPGYRDPTQLNDQQNSLQSFPQYIKENETESETPGYRDPTQMNESLKGHEAESETPGYRNLTQISQEKRGNLKEKISNKLAANEKAAENCKDNAMDVEGENHVLNSDVYAPETIESDGANTVIPESMETTDDDHDTVSVCNLMQDWTEESEIMKEVSKNKKALRIRNSELKPTKSNKQQMDNCKIVKLGRITEEFNSQEFNDTIGENCQEKQDNLVIETEQVDELGATELKENLAKAAAANVEIIAQKIAKKTDKRLKSSKILERRNVTKRRPTNSDAHLKSIPKNVNKRNTKGESILHTACVKGQMDYVKALLEAGANPNTKDNASWTPLQEAVTLGHREICKILLESGAAPNTPGMDNRTALHDAAINDRMDEATLLLKFNANTDVYDKFGKRPIDYAVSDEMRTLLKNSYMEKSGFGESACLNSTLDHSIVAPNAKVVVFPSNLSSQNKKLLIQMAAKHKIAVTTTFRPGVTHVVVEANERNTIDLTYNVMLAILEGKWILNSQWIAISTDMNDLSEIDFEIFQVEGAPHPGTPQRSRMNEEKQNPRLFNNCFFYFSIGVKASWNYGKLEFTKQNLTNLVLAGQGEVLNREPDPEDMKDFAERLRPFHVAHKPMHPLHRCSHYIIYMPGKEEPRVKYNMPHIKSLPLAWFFECIEKFALVDPILMGIS